MKKACAAALILCLLLMLCPMGASGSPTGAEWQERIRAAEEALMDKLAAAYPEVDPAVLARFRLLGSEPDYRTEGAPWAYQVYFAYDGVLRLDVCLTLDARSGDVVNRPDWDMDERIARYGASIGAEEAARIAREAYAAAFDDLRARRAREYRAFTERFGEEAARAENLQAQVEWIEQEVCDPFFRVCLFSPASEQTSQGRAPYETHEWYCVYVDAQTGALLLLDPWAEQGAEQSVPYDAPDVFYLPYDAWYWDGLQQLRQQSPAP